MARPFSVAASAEAHLDTSELAARRVDDDGRPAGEPLGRNAAQAAGTAVHRLLEKLVLQGDLTANWRRAAEELPALLERLAPAPQRAPALERARELVERIAAGGLLGRLAAIGPDGVVARELNLLVPPAESATQALGFVSGTVDLVYRDPSGELVVVDYKTDLAETEEALTELADAYRAQGTAYAPAPRASSSGSCTPAAC
jgi:ATP-dependent exoDNAse (exonuclease V) beta subunit